MGNFEYTDAEKMAGSIIYDVEVEETKYFQSITIRSIGMDGKKKQLAISGRDIMAVATAEKDLL